jgi:hypothetical protein
MDVDVLEDLPRSKAPLSAALHPGFQFRKSEILDENRFHLFQ